MVAPAKGVSSVAEATRPVMLNAIDTTQLLHPSRMKQRSNNLRPNRND